MTQLGAAHQPLIHHARCFALIVAQTVALLCVGCTLGSSAYRYVQPIVLDDDQLPDFAAVDFTQANGRQMAVSPHTASRFDELYRNSWPKAVRDALSRHRRSAGDRPLSRDVHVGAPNHVGWVGRRIRVDGECLFLLSNLSRDVDWERLPDGTIKWGDPYRLFELLAVVESGDGPPQVVLKDVPVSLHTQHMYFGAAHWADRLVLFYADLEAIYMRHARVVEGALVLEPAEPIAATAGIADLLARQDDRGRVHLVWAEMSEKGRSLHYMHLDGPEMRSPPRTISTTVNFGSVNLLVHEERVFITWIDSRFESGTWWETITRHKQFLTASSDRGDSFITPVTLNNPRDDDDTETHSITVPTKDGVLAFGRRSVTWLDAELRTAKTFKQPLQRGALEQWISDAMLRQHRALCGDD
jgi:hypothetical protein